MSFDADRHRDIWDDFVLARLCDDAIDPDAIAIQAGARRWSYGELNKEADRIARGCVGLGVRPHDPVVVQFANQVEFVTVCVGLFRIGAVPVLAMPSLRAAEIGHLIQSTQAQLVMSGGVMAGHDHRRMLRQFSDQVRIVVAGDAEDLIDLAELDGPPVRAARPDPSDVALMLLSGGTTSLPKLIQRTHRDYAFQMRQTALELGVTANWTYLAAIPVAHNAALGCPGVLGLLRLGGEVLMSPSPAPDQAFGLIHGHGHGRPILTTLMPAILNVWTECELSAG